MPVTLICPGCKEKFNRTPSEAARSKSNFCSHKCSASDFGVQAQIAGGRAWGSRAVKLPLDGTVERLYAEGISKMGIATRYGTSDETVRQFLQRRGIPTRSKAQNGTLVHAPRMAAIPNSEIVRMYRDGLPAMEIANHFKTSQANITARLRAEGVSLRRSFFGNDMPLRCEDGHLVRSRYEQQVCNWLWNHRIAHGYEPPMPGNPNRHADFLIGTDTYIEVWGITGSDTYKSRRHDKIADYIAAGVRLIGIYPRDIEGQLAKALA